MQGGGQAIYLAFVKNPRSFNLILRLVNQHRGHKHLLLAASHPLVDGEDFAWLWAVDIEAMAPAILDAVCSGNTPEELAMRLKYAEVPPHRVRPIYHRDPPLAA